jgi:hypothetical protein
MQTNETLQSPAATPGAVSVLVTLVVVLLLAVVVVV